MLYAKNKLNPLVKASFLISIIIIITEFSWNNL